VVQSVEIKVIHIKNFKSLKDVHIRCTDLIALIGENNAGKSNVLEALDFFFNTSKSKITEESFYGCNTDLPVEILIEFGNLNSWETRYFSYWLCDGELKVKRKITWNNDQVNITNVAIVKQPKVEWLQEEKVNSEKIKEWWEEKNKLVVGGVNFYELLGNRKPSVSRWKEAIKEFIEKHEDKIPWEYVEKENPKGYAGVLQGGLPKYILVPAIRYVHEEVRVQKTNPFGELIRTIFKRISKSNKKRIKKYLRRIRKLVNKEEAFGKRINEIGDFEKLLKSNLCPFVECDIEIRFPIPSLENLFENTEIFIDDGIRTSVEEKGHGLQRSVIFAILRTYAELIRRKSNNNNEKRKEKSIIFAIEEPELYLHPLAQRVMMEVLREISEINDHQVIYTTHSSTFVDITHFDEICLMRRERKDGEWESSVTQLSMDDMIRDLKVRHPHTTPTPESMREWYSHACGSARSEGFFARKVVIVEGFTEEYALPIYSKALGYDLDREGVSIINSGGKGQIDRLYRLFNEFKIPCYIIFDIDKDSEDSQTVKQSKELLDLMGWSSNNIPPVIIERNFTAFRETFEKAMMNEIADYSSLKDEAKQHLGITKESKPLIARYIAKKLIEKGEKEGDPTKYVPETIKEIIKRIKEVAWEGSILKK